MKLTNIYFYLLRLAFLILILIKACSAYGATLEGGSLPIPLEAYHDANIHGTWEKLLFRVQKEPFNLVATLIFFCSIVHTFMAGKFKKLSHYYEKKHHERLITMGREGSAKKEVCFKAELCHLLGEVEAIFGIWVVPLVVAIVIFFDWSSAIDYIDNKVSFLEAVFVVVVMVIAATRPIVTLAENCLSFVARLGGGTPAAWWLIILMIAPLFGSFITEPAAMTIGAMLLSKQFYDLKPSTALKYGTLGLLFTNVSVGGTLTNFAAPPVLMIASKWQWDTLFMLKNFGYKVAVGVILSSIVYYLFFRKELKTLASKSQKQARVGETKGIPIPKAVTLIHLIFLGWTVASLHYAPLVIGGFLFFIAFTHLTLQHQYELNIKGPLLVGFFLAGLVIHGGLQQWWLEPVLGGLERVALFCGATILTAFNDNAAITYLASQVPSFTGNIALQKAIVYGAVAGGGLTVIANAPNPAGQSILSRYFPEGISPMKLFLGALLPTFLMALSFMLLP